MSIKITGFYNILISVVAAVLTYGLLILIANKFGGTVGSDAYFFIISIATLIGGLISSLYSVVLIPKFIDIQTNSGMQEAYDFASSILGLTLLIICPFAILTIVYNSVFFSFVSKFTVVQINQIDHLLIYFAPILLATVISDFFRSLTLARSRFVLSALGALFPPLFTVAIVLFTSTKLAEESLLLAFFLSKVFALALYAHVSLKFEEIRICFWRIHKKHLALFTNTSTPYFSANIVTNFATFFFDYMATGLSSGTLTSVAYAQKIFMIPVSVFVNPLMEIARTRIANLMAIGNLDAIASLYKKLFQNISLFTIPAAIFLFFFASEVIGALFQHGAFTSQNREVASASLKVFSIAIPFSALFLLNGRTVEAFQKLTWPSVFGSIGHLVSIFITFVLVNRIGYLGIPISKVVLELLYFLPFGFIALKIFMGYVPRKNYVLIVLLPFVVSLFSAMTCNILLYPVISPLSAQARLFLLMVCYALLNCLPFVVLWKLNKRNLSG